MSRTNNGKKLPRFYLKQFGVPEKKREIWRFSRAEDRPELVDIGEIADSAPLGQLPDSGDGPKRAEALWGEAWPRIATGFTDLNQPWTERCIALVAAGLLSETSGGSGDEESLDQAFSSLIEEIPLGKAGQPDLKSADIGDTAPVFNPSRWFTHRYPTGFDQERYPIEVNLGDPGDTARILMEKRWSVITAPGPWFITTDHPVTVLNREQTSFGLDNAGTFLLFPLSPTRLLVMDDDHEAEASGYYTLNREGPALYNYLKMIQRSDFFFSQRNPAEVTFEVLSMLGYLYSGRM